MWAGFLGPGAERQLRAALGPAAVVETGPDYGLGVDGSEFTRLDLDPCNGLTAMVGHPDSDGSSVCIRPDRAANRYRS